MLVVRLDTRRPTRATKIGGGAWAFVFCIAATARRRWGLALQAFYSATRTREIMGLKNKNQLKIKLNNTISIIFLPNFLDYFDTSGRYKSSDKSFCSYALK